MISRSPSLTVVVPRCLERLQDLSDGPLDGEGALAFIAGRGRVERRWPAKDAEHARLYAWQYGLLEVLGLDRDGRSAAFPSAATCALGTRSVSRAHASDRAVDWLHVEPIHLAAGLSEVTLVPLRGELAVYQTERDALSDVLGTHLQAEGFTLQPYGQSEWLLAAPRVLEAQTVTVSFAARNAWNAALPQGRDGPTLRRLMTELQMLLHDHPINAARQARGVPEINAVWLWGNGTVDAQPRASSRPCLGDHAYLRGLCQANGWEAPLAIAPLEAALECAHMHPASVLVIDDAMLEALDTTLSSVLGALKRGRIGRVDLVVDEWRLSVDRWALRRFWRRPAPAAAWARA